MKQALPILCLISAFCACASIPSIDSRISQDGAASKQLKLGIIITDETKKSLKSHYESVASWARLQGQSFEPNRFFDQLSAVLKANFSDVTVINNLQEAQSGNADLVGILDIRSDFLFSGILTISPESKIRANFNMVTLEQNPIDSLSINIHGKGMWFYQNEQVYNATADAGAAKFENALAASSALAAFARERLKSRPDAVATNPVPKAEPQRAEPHRSDVYAPSYSAHENPNNYALVIGIEKYSSIPEAQFAERDAEAVREHLIALGYPPRNVIYLGGESASRSGIQKYVESWLPRNINDESRVFVYFSGHGAPDPETRQGYLVPWDGDPKFLKNTGYPIKKLYEKLSELKAKEVILAMDSCFSGEGGRSVIAKGTRPLVTEVDTELSASDKLVVLAASAANEITGTEEKQGQGLFTYYLLKALNESKGEATIAQLFRSLLPRVRDAARRQNRDQTPQLFPEKPGKRASEKLR